MTPWSLIVHADGTIAGCTEDGERDGWRGRDECRDGGTVRCINWHREYVDRAEYDRSFLTHGLYGFCVSVLPTVTLSR